MQNQPETKHETQESSQAEGESLGRAIRQTIVEQPSSGNPKSGYFTEGKNWVSFFTLLFVGAYTILTVLILRNAQEQVQISRMNFRMDQRPYLLVEDVKGQTLSFKRDEKARWDIQYINYGKSPAVKEETDANIWVRTTAATKMNDFFNKLPKIASPNHTSFIVPPNVNAGKGENGFHYLTLFSDAKITEDDYAFMKTVDGGVIMAGRAWYYDIFGDPHWTDFCRYTLITGAISDCPSHNEIR
jgi:hypothetical protein